MPRGRPRTHGRMGPPPRPIGPPPEPSPAFPPPPPREPEPVPTREPPALRQRQDELPERLQVAIRQLQEARERAEFEEYAAGQWEREQMLRETTPEWATEEKWRELQARLDAARRQRGEEKAHGLVPMPERLWIASEQAARAGRRVTPTVQTPRISQEQYIREAQRGGEVLPQALFRMRRGTPWPAEKGARGIPMAGISAPEAQREMEREWPWSAYGREVVEKVPWEVLGEGVGGGWFMGGPAGGEHGRIALGAVGETIGHEYGHAAGAPWFNSETGQQFWRDVRDWIMRKPTKEWTGDDYFVYRWLVEAPVFELYAGLSQRPQMIPPELEHWFPQYDLTKRRSMGVSQPLGYRGPTLTQYGGGFPPPPHGAGYGSRVWR